ncbi:hypothetical protein [Melittangium boletus]|uniref:Lipoprotein n=1 Tax=Melittangium boletus DSM 14713 TaxID=1294270 RepID=A0A250IGB5_9BACT|nr:hypothetical protein [Melittangium boletus]ATB30191.1 hypothetical protein MEBOL_003646 [Melittangium boletus DSM 14713]
MRSPLLHPLASLLLACALACGSAPESPRLDTVQPPQAFYGTPEHLRLRGAFAPDLSVDLGSDAPPSLENRFEVRIGSERAYAVRFLTRDMLEATAPATLPPGRHDLTVIDAQGRASTLPGGFEVVDRGVHRLVFVTSMRSAHTGEWSEPIRVELRDGEDRPAPTSLPRVVRLTSDSDTGRFARVGGNEPVPSLELTLAPGESGVDLVYRDSTPGYHTLEGSSLGLPPIAQTVAVGRLGPPHQVRFTQLPLSPLRAGEPAALALEVLDASGGPAALPLTGIRVELRTDAPSGGLARTASGPYHPALVLTLQRTEGRLPLLYRDTRGAAQVRLSAHAINQDTLTTLIPDNQRLSVQPGPTHRFEVLRDDSGPPRVGEPESFTLQALDAWDNPTSYAGPVLVGTLPPDPDFSPGGVTLEAGRASLSAEFTQVGTRALVIWNPHQPDVRGTSAPLVVGPGRPVLLRVTGGGGPQRAGEPFALTLEALDRFGHRAQTPLRVTLSALGVAQGALSPTRSGTFTGTTTLSVTFTTAVHETHLRFEEENPEGPPGLSATTGDFTVRPGPTSRFLVEDTADSPTAGVAFPVRVRAVDAWGNPSEDVHELSLGAEGLSDADLSPTRFASFQGEATVSLTLTRAHVPTRLTVEANGRRGQQTKSFTVRPGAFASYELKGPGCITETDNWSLSLTARDAWGNRVSSYTGKARLSVQPKGTPSPGETASFVEGGTHLQLSLNEIHAPQAHVTITARDSAHGGKQGTLQLSLQRSCR